MAVVGAGLSGLTTAYRLHTAGWRVTVSESESEIGGRTKSYQVGGYLIDSGASALGASYRAYLELTEELGIRADVLPSSPYVGIFGTGGSITCGWTT